VGHHPSKKQSPHRRPHEQPNRAPGRQEALRIHDRFTQLVRNSHGGSGVGCPPSLRAQNLSGPAPLDRLVTTGRHGAGRERDEHGELPLLYSAVERSGREARSRCRSTCRSGALDQQLSKTGNFKAGEPLEAEARVIKGAKKVVTDGPLRRGQDLVAGYRPDQRKTGRGGGLSARLPVSTATAASEVRPIRQM